MIKLILIMAFSCTCFAKVNQLKTFHCKVVGYDETDAFVNCDPKVKSNLKLPKIWFLNKGEKLKINQIISFSLDDEQILEWAKINSIAK
ncbi:MAG: hypothetical protein H6625_03560 [Bdellovibrionaceae bacterium]|nr:hypothetical protein [Pseudobdellovibrionaceae bacterium]